MAGRNPSRQGTAIHDVGSGHRKWNIRKTDRHAARGLGDVAQQAGEAGALFDRFDGGGGEIAPGRGEGIMPLPAATGVRMTIAGIRMTARVAGRRWTATMVLTVCMVRGGENQPRHGGEQEAGDGELAGAAPHGWPVFLRNVPPGSDVEMIGCSFPEVKKFGPIAHSSRVTQPAVSRRRCPHNVA